MIQKNARCAAPKCSEKNIRCHDIFTIRCDSMPALFGADREHEFLRRLRDTTVMAYTDTSGGHLRREKRGVRSEFLGLIII